MTELSTVRDIRSSLLVTVTDPLPVGAGFIEARFHEPEGEWHPEVPGAKLATLANGVLAAPPQPHTGRFPLPATDQLRATLDDWGITVDTPVVVYSAEPGEAKTAARAWFVLRGAGIRDVRVLDGGVEGWRARRATQAEDAATPESAETTAVRPVTAIDAAQAAEIGQTGLLLDARPASAFDRGHIPGAVSAPGGEVFRDDYLLPADELAAWAESLGAEGTGSVAAYCGGGMAAAGTVFALATLGLDAQLYVGSWSQWSRLPDAPVES